MFRIQFSCKKVILLLCLNPVDFESVINFSSLGVVTVCLGYCCFARNQFSFNVYAL